MKNPSASAGDLGSIPGQGDPLEKDMATRSSVLAWRTPWTEEAGGLQSMASQRVRHDSAAKHNIKSEQLKAVCLLVFISEVLKDTWPSPKPSSHEHPYCLCPTVSGQLIFTAIPLRIAK